MTDTIKRIKLAAAIIVVSAFCFTFWRRAEAAQEIQYPRPEIIGIGVPMIDRLGTDDQAALVIHFSGDIHGGLEPCG